MSFRAILFDLGDTLFQLHPMPEVQQELAEVLVRTLGVSAETARLACERALQSHKDEAMAAWRSGRTDEPPLDEVLKRHFSPHVSLTTTASASLADVLWRADVARFNPGPDCASRVDRFRSQGYRLAAVSNTSTHAPLLDAFLASVGLLPLFETVVYSSGLGLRKPHPEIYREALRRISLEPGEAVFVGDRVREDVLGPRSVGMAAVLSHEFRAEDPGNSNPLAVIGCLSELGGVLRPLD